MGKYAPQAIKDAWPIVDSAFRSVEFSGILEGSSAGNGYHHSREDLIRRGKTNAYSIQHPLDKKGDPRAASAIDFTFNDVDELIVATRRLLTAARNKDPRLFMKCREFGGTLDGKRVTAYNVTEQRFISMDSTHLWHEHVSGHRAFVNDQLVWRGIAEVIAGINATENTKGAGWWHVDPVKVDTFLWGLKNGTEKNIQAVPGRDIDIDHWVTSGGRTWGVTDSNNWFDKAFLAEGKYKTITPPSPPAAGGESAPIEEGFPMAEMQRKRYFCDQPQKAKTPGEWQYLVITNEGNWSITAGPAEVIGKLHIRINLAKDTSAYFRVVEEDIDDDGTAHPRVAYYDHEEIEGTATGDTYRNWPIDLSVGAPKKGYRDNLVRIQWKSSDPEATILRADVVRRSTGR